MDMVYVLSERGAAVLAEHTASWLRWRRAAYVGAGQPQAALPVVSE